jgi:hypothetical protein
VAIAAVCRITFHRPRQDTVCLDRYYLIPLTCCVGLGVVASSHLCMLPPQLASPVFHPGYFEEVYKILQCICYNCCRIRTSKPSRLREILAVKSGKARLNALYTLCAGMVACGHSESAPEAKTTVSNLALGEPQSEEDGGCYFVQPKFFRKGLSIYTCDRKEAKGDLQDRDVLRMEKAYSMLQRIPDCDVKYFGLNPRLVRPEHLMITVSVLQTTRGSYRFPFSAVCFLLTLFCCRNSCCRFFPCRHRTFGPLFPSVPCQRETMT